MINTVKNDTIGEEDVFLADTANAILIEAARNRFVNFAKEMKKDLKLTAFHKVYYEVLDLFAKGEIKKLIVTVPPQHGKSEGSSRLLPSFILGRDPNKKILIGSYAATIAQDFNRNIQKVIESPRYHEIFPDTNLNRSNVVTVAGSYLRNSTVFEIVGKEGGLRAVGRGGSLTSKTIDISILDDVYKDYAEGNSPIVRQAAWFWYTTVVRTRLHNDAQELIVFTRWNEDDLIGRIEKSGEKVVELKSWSDLGKVDAGGWLKVNFEAIKTGEPTEIDPRQPGEALFPERHNAERLNQIRQLDPVGFDCLYQGRPGGIEGRLYKTAFKTWVNKEDYGIYVRSGNYTDVADEGKDYLFSVCYDIFRSKDKDFYNQSTKKFEYSIYALITDMVYTKEDTDATVQMVSSMMNRNGTLFAWVESNGGGAQFEKQLKKKVRAETNAFYQKDNKESRIVTNAPFVNSQIIFPFGWKDSYPKVYEAVTSFLRDFKANTNDDVADGLTGVYEKEIAPGNPNPYNKQKRGIKVRG